jgi:hypothetical protein
MATSLAGPDADGRRRLAVFNSIHLLWHLLHLDVFGTVDRIGNVVALGGVLVLSILLLLPHRDGRPADPAVTGV